VRTCFWNAGLAGIAAGCLLVSPVAAASARVGVRAAGGGLAVTVTDGANDVYAPGPISSGVEWNSDEGSLHAGGADSFDYSGPTILPAADLASMSEKLIADQVVLEARIRGRVSLASRNWSTGRSQIVWLVGQSAVAFTAPKGIPTVGVALAVPFPCPSSGFRVPVLRQCGGGAYVSEPVAAGPSGCGERASVVGVSAIRVIVPFHCLAHLDGYSGVPSATDPPTGWIRYDDVEGGSGLHADPLGDVSDRYVALVRSAHLWPDLTFGATVGISARGAVEALAPGGPIGQNAPGLLNSPDTPIVAAASVTAPASPFSRTWCAMADGGVYGWDTFFGSMSGRALRSPIVGIAARPSGDGYWLAGADGGVFAFGSAPYAGGLGGTALRAPVVGIAATPSGDGYWLVSADGGVFAFGDAGYAGRVRTKASIRPVVAIAAVPTGNGYWIVQDNGAVTAFGSAKAHGDLATTRLNAPVTSIAVTESGDGYWLGAADGGIFTFGDAAS